ncbi:MAG: hypothetical protein HXX20_00060 [Chloroflexi bacterium]|nr:hypothetical protein [Chloroflexota bacterium]
MTELVNKDQSRNLDLPCLGLDGIQIFAPTADQRFLGGSSTFLRTHFPIKLQSHPHIGQLKNVTEQHLLNIILNPNPNLLGNRVFVLYGAAGSGKSELLRWLQTQITQNDTLRSNVTVRISRTELDVFQIVQRFQQMYTEHSFELTTQQRWEICRQKPRTLAKILVLTALERLLDSDEQINAIYYQLIDLVQTNLEGCFAAITQPSDEVGQFIELFSRENLWEVLKNSVIPIPIDYETLRYHLLKVFREQLLENTYLPHTLKGIAERVQAEHHQRPILLIDDLVQSINIFATDLLDYFITLEEGCWDIVVGITPASLEATKRGKELLDRINFLDTIDDRVEKLWLSDEYGLYSSFLDETNCIDYARLYLSEYKRQNHQSCDTSCPIFDQCQNLDPEQSEELLAPFNRELLIRLFRSLPSGKGKVRYFNLYLRNILEQLSKGEDVLQVLEQYVKSEQAVYHHDRTIVQVYELYGPLFDPSLPNEENEASSFSGLHHFFKLPPFETNTPRPVLAPLIQNNLIHLSEVQMTPTSSLPIDPGKLAIKAWLQNEPVNKQLLRDLRRGVIKSIKDGYFLDTLTRLNVANPTRILRWAQTRLETVPPVQLEGVDNFEGLSIHRSIGPLAYTLYDFADATGATEQKLRSQILASEQFPFILFRGMAYRQSTRDKLEQVLGIKLEELAFCLLTLANGLGRCPVELPPAIEQKIGVEDNPLTIRYPDGIESERPRLTNNQLGIIRRLFDDCFKLRENVYDGLLLEEIAEQIEPQQAITLLRRIDPSKISTDFRLNDEPLGIVLSGILNELETLIRLGSDERTKKLLFSICEVGLGEDIAERQLADLLKLPGDLDSLLSNFLQECHPFTLHKVLGLVRLIEEVQRTRTLNQVRQMLSTLIPNQNGDITPVTTPFEVFSRFELETLMKICQPDFRLPLNSFALDFLLKLAQHLPNLYEQLELRLRFG